ncbi:Ig-like domain-containing protein [Acinetobacter junii]|uniref:Ig-like domain-containing protein n=1 Tax=Acinetobacter junii TaxID=40215 RepID=UPI00367010BB
MTFTPNAGTGQKLHYSISDGQGGSATATETINVSAAPTRHLSQAMTRTTPHSTRQ